MTTTDSKLVQEFRAKVQDLLGSDARQIAGSISEVHGAIVCLDVKFDTLSGVVYVAAQRDSTPLFFDRYKKRINPPLPKAVMSNTTKGLLSGVSESGQRGAAAMNFFKRNSLESWSNRAALTAVVVGGVVFGVGFFIAGSLGASLTLAGGLGAFLASLIAAGVLGAVAYKATMKVYSANEERVQEHFVALREAVVDDIYAATSKMVFTGGPEIFPGKPISATAASVNYMSVALDEMTEKMEDDELNPSDPPEVNIENYPRLRKHWSDGEKIYADFKVIFQQIPGHLFVTGSGYRFEFDIARSQTMRDRYVAIAREKHEEKLEREERLSGRTGAKAKSTNS